MAVDGAWHRMAVEIDILLAGWFSLPLLNNIGISKRLFFHN